MTGKNAKLLSKAGITIAKGNKLELDEDTLKKADTCMYSQKGDLT